MPAADQHDDLPIGVDSWGEKEMAGAYKRGTTFTMEDGSKVKFDELPDYIGGSGKRPAAKKSVPRAPSRDGS